MGRPEQLVEDVPVLRRLLDCEQAVREVLDVIFGLDQEELDQGRFVKLSSHSRSDRRTGRPGGWGAGFSPSTHSPTHRFPRSYFVSKNPRSISSS